MKYFVIVNALSPYGVEMLKKPGCVVAGPHPVLVGIELHTEGMHYVSVVLDAEPGATDQTEPTGQPSLRTETYIPHSAVVGIQAGGDERPNTTFGFG